MTGREKERGFSLLEASMAACLAAILMAAAVPAGERMIRAAVLDHEAQLLASDLRFLQEISSDAVYLKRGLDIEEKGERLPEFRMNIYEYAIRIPNGATLRRHTFPPDVVVGIRNASSFSFENDGIPANRQMGSIFLYCKKDLSLKRRVVIDQVGRIRIDRE